MLEGSWEVLGGSWAAFVELSNSRVRQYKAFGRVWVVLGGSWAGLNRPGGVLGMSCGGVDASLVRFQREPGARVANQTPAILEKWLKWVRVVQFQGSGEIFPGAASGAGETTPSKGQGPALQLSTTFATGV